MKEIRKIIDFYDSIDQSKDKIALASVVNVEESSYRRIGARMLVTENGTWIGGISGGCLEGDALKRSQMAIFNNKPSRVVYDTMDDDKNQIGVGLGCNGKIEVLFNPIQKENHQNEIELLKNIQCKREPALLIKVIASELDTYLGNVVLVNEKFWTADFCQIEKETLVELVREVFERKRNKVLNLRNLDGHEMKLLFEFIKPEIHLIIIGDNYDVHALVCLCNELGWAVSIVGRSKKIPKEVFKLVDRVYEYEQVSRVVIDEYCAVILMSHDYEWDKKMLPIFINHTPTYLGMLGPRKRMDKMKNELGMFELDELPFFYSPVGLDIGAESPEEISLAIASEILSVFRVKEGRSLKYKKGAIHERIG